MPQKKARELLATVQADCRDGNFSEETVLRLLDDQKRAIVAHLAAMAAVEFNVKKDEALREAVAAIDTEWA